MALARIIDRIGELPVVRFWVRFSAAGPTVLAGAIAYNIIFALVPGGIVLLTGASFFGRTEDALSETVRVISLIAPAEVAEEIGRVLGTTSEIVAGREGLVIALGAVLALWFGTRAVLTIMRVLTRVEDIDEDPPLGHDGNQALHLQLGKRLSQGGAADIQLLGQFAYIDQGPRFKRAFFYLAAQIIKDLFTEAPAVLGYDGRHALGGILLIISP